MKNSLALPDVDHCTGCRVCRDICPKNAILMETDKHGFVYPTINLKICIGCKLCKKNCPIINRPATNDEVSEAYVGTHKDLDIIKNSASGGAFSAIVSSWEPDTVCGVRWDMFRAINDIATNKDDIKKFSKSKYIISDTNHIYEKAAKELKLGKRVLFSGSPCHIAAFKNYIGKEYDKSNNLLLVDIVCHGAPSELILKKYLINCEKKQNKKIISFSFFDKSTINSHPTKRSALLSFSDGSSAHLTINTSSFLKLYYERIAYRKSCSNCPFASSERLSDITIGDAHHIEELFPDLSVNKGVSEILVHTYKAKNMVKEIEKYMDIRTIPYKWALDHNKMLVEPTTINPKTSSFYDLIDSGVDFDLAVKRATHKSVLIRVLGKIRKRMKQLIGIF